MMTHESQRYPIEPFSKRLLFSFPALAIAIVIFYFSSLEDIDLPLDEISFNDLIFHFMAYFFFGLSLLVAAYPWQHKWPYPVSTLVVLILIGVAYAASDEIHQFFIPNRTCTLADFLADSAGVAFSILIGNKFIRNPEKLFKTGL